MSASVSSAPPALQYARAAGWDRFPRLLRSEDSTIGPWLAMWCKRGALKVATTGRSPDEALDFCFRHAARLLGCPGSST